jgi:hypothetical protein
MALAKAAAVSVATTTWTDVVSITGNGTKQVMGFAIDCEDATTAFRVRVLYEGTEVWAPMNCPAGQTIVVYDAPYTIPNAGVWKVQAYQSVGTKNFDGTIFGA